MLHAAMHGLPFPARWDDVRVLLAVLREGSFSGAAQVLSVEQSTVSRRIAALETALGGALFDRTAAGPRPTELALRLLPQAERMEAELTKLVDLSAEGGEVRGRVRLALASSFAVQVVVPFLLPQLRRLYPQLRVDLVVDERAADLGHREADIAVRFFRPTQGDYVAKRVARLSTAVLGHQRYLEGRTPTLSKLDWIVFDLPGASTPDAAFLAAHAPAVEPVMRTNSHLVQVEAVRSGLGVALLVRAICAIDPGLVELSLPLPDGPQVELWLVTPRSLSTVPRVRAVWEFLDERLSDLEQTSPTVWSQT
jgi:DNA-binding transcriptional LysR family regulator